MEVSFSVLQKPFRTYSFSWNLAWFQILLGSALVFIPYQFHPQVTVVLQILPPIYGWTFILIGFALLFDLIFIPYRWLARLNPILHWLSSLILALLGWQLLTLGAQINLLGLPLLTIALLAALVPFLPQASNQTRYFDLSTINIAVISLLVAFIFLIQPQLLTSPLINPLDFINPFYVLLALIAALLLTLTQIINLHQFTRISGYLTAIIIMLSLLLPNLILNQLNPLSFITLFLITGAISLYWQPCPVRTPLVSWSTKVLSALLLLSFILLGAAVIIVDPSQLNPFHLTLYLFCSILMASVFTQLISQPIIKFEKTVTQIINQPSFTPIPITGPQEIKSLIRIFNQLNQQNHFAQQNLTHQIQTQTQELTQSKQHLTQLLNRLKAILEATEAPLLALNPQGKIIIFNHAASQLTGKSGHHAFGKHPLKLLKLMDHQLKSIPESQSPFQQVLTTRQNFITDPQQYFYIHNAQNQAIPVSLNISPVTDLQHQIIGVVCVFHDISITKHLRELQNELVFVAAHELKNPVAAIAGYIEMAQEARPRSPKIKTALNAITQANLRLTTLIENLLQVARFESGKLTPQLSATHLPSLLNQVFKDQQIQIKTKKIYIKSPNNKSKSPSSTAQVLADPHFLEEILHNLIGNALKYTPPKGTITITHQLSTQSTKYHQPTKNQPPKFLVTHIKDTGTGIPPDEQTQIFNKFFRASNAAGTEGNGLGLFIIKHLLEKINGCIWFKSQEGKGSTFSFSLPLAKSKA